MSEQPDTNPTREQTFDGEPRTPDQFGWDLAVEVARTPGGSHHRLSLTLGTIAAAADELDRLRAERDRLAAERDALVDFPIYEWPGGGHFIRLPYEPAGYEGGVRDTLECGYHFDRIDDARAAVRKAAGLGTPPAREGGGGES